MRASIRNMLAIHMFMQIEFFFVVVVHRKHENKIQTNITIMYHIAIEVMHHVHGVYLRAVNLPRCALHIIAYMHISLVCMNG